MEHARIVELVARTVEAARRGEAPLGDRQGSIPVAHYTSPERLARERAALFARLPIPLAAARELDEPGRVLVRALDGVPLLLTRGADGVVRAMRNACRHRATRLADADCRAKALVCPYHGWTYSLAGELLHVPRAEAFPDCDRAALGLAQVRAEERHGLIWVALDGAAPDARAHLGELDGELGALGLGDHVVARRATSEQRGNWKLLIEAFLEGYHIRTLHRDTIYPFFVDACGIAERAGVHMRHASARRTALDPAGAGRPARALATYAYVIFPCTVLIVHPDWISHVVVQPLAPDRFSWTHAQLVPAAASSEAERAHFERSFALIEEQVFQREDLRAIAAMDAGHAACADGRVRFGLLESAALWLHDAIERALAPG